MGMNETMLDVKYPFGPGLKLNASGVPLETFRVYEMLMDDDDADRQGLGRRRMLRTVAPQVDMDITPFYDVGGDSASIRKGADVASALGMRALHTGVDPFNFSAAHIAQVKADVAYAHSKGLVVAFYVLLQNPPNMSSADEVIDPTTGDGEGIACFATAFHRNFRDGLVAFVQATGFDFLDTDGPFEQAPCGSTTHEHAGLVDSQVAQWQANVAWYRTLPSMPNPLAKEGSGIMISCPDPYELAGGTWNSPIGYTVSGEGRGQRACTLGEHSPNTSYSHLCASCTTLARPPTQDAWNTLTEPWTWLLLGRTYVYDGTMHKTPTNGGMCYDLSRAGSMNTTDELRFFNTSLSVFLGAAGRCFLGGDLYQNAASEAILRQWMGTLNRFRDVLNGDIVHVKKPNGRSWDAMLHVLPTAAPGAVRGFVIFWNPSMALEALVSTNLSVYYCGFAPGASVRVEWSDGSVEQVQQDAFFGIALRTTVEAKGYAWAALS